MKLSMFVRITIVKKPKNWWWFQKPLPISFISRGRVDE
tara:strand:- start:214 stop:327 length:114 start_codon:yes stop_codon:yes gene_type:complete